MSVSPEPIRSYRQSTHKSSTLQLTAFVFYRACGYLCASTPINQYQIILFGDGSSPKWPIMCRVGR